MEKNLLLCFKMSNVIIPFTYFQKIIFSENCIFLKKRCYRLYKHKLFDNFILASIVISSIKLVIDTYWDDDDTTSYTNGHKTFISVLEVTDLVFNGIFIFELLTKTIALGFVMDFNSYLRDTWS